MPRGATFLSLLFSVPVFLAPPTAAFESLPEFSSLTEEEQAAFEGPARLGSEYQSDILTYMKPLDWEYDWLTQPLVMDLSLGSTSARHFMVDGRLRLRKKLLGNLEFRFTYFDERDREMENLHHVFEFIFRPANAKFGLSAYGEPSLYKRQNDVGLAAMIYPAPTHEIRVFNTFVDITRHKRNDRTDLFDPAARPYSRGLVGRWWTAVDSGKREYFEYAFRHEGKTRWRFPDEQYEYGYQKLLASVFFQKQLSLYAQVQSRWQIDRKFEARWPGQSWRTDRLQGLGRVSFRPSGCRDCEWTPGLLYAARIWRTDGGKVRYRDLLPHVWLKWKGMNLGYEMTWHRLFGTWEAAFEPSEVRDPEDVDSAMHHRLNTGYEFRFEQARAALELMVTWDLDRLGRRVWQGGNVRFRALF